MHINMWFPVLIAVQWQLMLQTDRCLFLSCCRGRHSLTWKSNPEGKHTNSVYLPFYFLWNKMLKLMSSKYLLCAVCGFSPRSSESAWGRWEKEVPLYTWSSSFSFTCVMVSQSRTLVGSGCVSFTPPPCTSTFRVCQRLKYKKKKNRCENIRKKYGVLEYFVKVKVNVWDSLIRWEQCNHLKCK